MRLASLVRGALRGARAELHSGGQGWWPVFSTARPFAGPASKSLSGPVVSAETVLQLSAVYACVSRTAQLVSCLPGSVFDKLRDGSRVRADDDLTEILALKPNPVQTAPEFWEGMLAHMMMRGNAYAERLTVGGRLVGLRPLIAVSPRLREDRQFDYRVTENGATEVLPPEKVFHLRGFGGGDGLGLSVVRYGVQSFGAALAADETAAGFFGNALTPSGVLKYDGDEDLTPDQRKQMQEYLDQFTGSRRAGKVMLLEGGMTWQQASLSPEDAQLLETRRFQIEDVCRWFGIPPIVIGHASDGQTMWGTGVEAIMLSWMTTGVNPLLRRIEARIRADLIPPALRRTRYFEFNREAVLQMDSGAKADFLSRMVASGVMSSDEAREKLNLERRGGAADELRAQTATAPLELLGGRSE